MSKYLIMTSEVYRVGSEKEAENAINEAKKDNRFELAKYTAVKKNRNFTLSKYSSEYKCSKAKGEVVDEWYRVILTKEFTSEKEPDCTTTVSYNVEAGAFPDPVSREDEEDEF